MKSLKNIAILAGALLIATTSCDKDETPETPTAPATGEFVLEIENVWGSSQEPFALNTELVHPMTGDSLTFTTMKYYVSNVKLQDTEGNWWVQDESYFLVDASQPESAEITIANVPAAEYVAMEITMGVDSVRNFSGAQTGALDPAHTMFWSWNNGYIMIKAEGQSPQSATGSFAFHLGGFSGPNKAVNTLSMSFSGTPMRVAENATPQMHVLANPARLWHTAGSVSVNATQHAPGETAGIMAGDFHSWIHIDHIHN